MSVSCYCNSGKAFAECCEPYILGKAKAPTAEALMRSRYAAYCVQNADYLLATTHLSTRKYHNRKDILAFATENHWVKLEIVEATENIVEFKAYYLDRNLQPHTHHEKSTFKKAGEQWYYVDGKWY
ncbi:YchJ family protein [Flavobacterium suncheonense]|uniref:Preprotein translocase subunit SecA n=1 Tax=Flavobacterium suncheonense GH29-5 = DSM 17707 TaxID=1121899 RepID=A0A0A2M8W8_9FLAO|nr:YchJ family metal-binding protein [Flavobacterium suncheonense]KGO87908.1 preprotein translocase subunit SecA [Flavobacterium suncheonense GH29-5 = DSM 17707]